jgi:hypothetical protein
MQMIVAQQERTDEELTSSSASERLNVPNQARPNVRELTCFDFF